MRAICKSLTALRSALLRWRTRILCLKVIAAPLCAEAEPGLTNEKWRHEWGGGAPYCMRHSMPAYSKRDSDRRRRRRRSLGARITALIRSGGTSGGAGAPCLSAERGGPRITALSNAHLSDAAAQ